MIEHQSDVEQFCLFFFHPLALQCSSSRFQTFPESGFTAIDRWYHQVRRFRSLSIRDLRLVSWNSWLESEMSYIRREREIYEALDKIWAWQSFKSEWFLWSYDAFSFSLTQNSISVMREMIKWKSLCNVSRFRN